MGKWRGRLGVLVTLLYVGYVDLTNTLILLLHRTQ